ncbi:MAG: hypothetical protein ACI4OJ_04200 [Lachnospiraceae bacterium]
MKKENFVSVIPGAIGVLIFGPGICMTMLLFLLIPTCIGFK